MYQSCDLSGGYALNNGLLLQIRDSIRFATFLTPEHPLLQVPLLLVNHPLVIHPQRPGSHLQVLPSAAHHQPLQPLASLLLLQRLVLVLLRRQPSLATCHQRLERLPQEHLYLPELRYLLAAAGQLSRHYLLPFAAAASLRAIAIDLGVQQRVVAISSFEGYSRRRRAARIDARFRCPTPQATPTGRAFGRKRHSFP